METSYIIAAIVIIAWAVVAAKVIINVFKAPKK